MILMGFTTYAITAILLKKVVEPFKQSFVPLTQDAKYKIGA